MAEPIKLIITPDDYAKVCAVVDRVKTDERSLDTDQYAGMILDALDLEVEEVDPRVFKEDDPDPTPDTYPFCNAERDGYSCTWRPGHSHPQHVAGTGAIVAAVWPVTD